MKSKRKGRNFNTFLTRLKNLDREFSENAEKELLKLRIALKLKRLRQKKHKTQSELAKSAKTSQAAVARYESEGYVAYELMTLWRLAEALDAELFIDFKPKHKKIA